MRVQKEILFNMMKMIDFKYSFAQIDNSLECFEYILDNLDTCNSYLKKRVFDNLIALYSFNLDAIGKKYQYNPNEYQYKKRFIEINTLSQASPQYDTTSAKTIIPECEGLYLIGQCAFNPFTREEFYWLKVGKASNIAKRMAHYATHSPMIWKQDFYITNCKEDKDLREEYCHYRLEEVAIDKGEKSAEWFRVTRETYLEICEKQFSYFFS